MQKQLVKEN